MNILKTYRLLLFLLVGWCGAAIAQDAPVEALQLRPLDALIADALLHSPVLQMERIDAELLHSELTLLKKEWSQYLALSGSFQVGNVQFIDNLSTGSGPDVRTVTRENIFAVAGVTVRLPLSDFLTKAERRKQIDLQLEQERYDLRKKEMEIRELVIRQYNDLQRSLRELSIRNQDLGFHEMAAQTAERYFREGTLSIEDYTNTWSKRNESALRVENARMDAQLLYLLLKEVVGAEITI
ncbi:MAG: TolC family protein [Saprospiraceae bacterium]